MYSAGSKINTYINIHFKNFGMHEVSNKNKYSFVLLHEIMQSCSIFFFCPPKKCILPVTYLSITKNILNVISNEKKKCHKHLNVMNV